MSGDGRATLGRSMEGFRRQRIGDGWRRTATEATLGSEATEPTDTQPTFPDGHAAAVESFFDHWCSFGMLLTQPR